MARGKTQYTEILYVYATPPNNKYVREAAHKAGLTLTEYVDHLISKDKRRKKRVRSDSIQSKAA